MSDFKNSLAYLITNQVPDYIKAEFPQFVLFLEKYYEFLDQDGEANNVLLNASSFSDINNTLDVFIPSFREQYLQMFPKDSLITDKRLIKFIREFYEAKGSEESILFIFRTFFNEHVDIIYPSKYVLKASDGVWLNREKMRITTDDTISLDPFELKGKRAKIYSHIDIGTVSTFETHNITVDEVTRLAYSTVPTYELYVKHEENDTVTLPGAGANAVPLIVDGEIKAITGDPLVSSHYFDPAVYGSTLVATVAVSGTAGQFTCGASTLAVGDLLRITGTKGGTATITGYATGTVYKVSAVTGSVGAVTGFTLTTQAGVAIVTTAGTLTGLTYTVNNSDIYARFYIPAHGFTTGDCVIYDPMEGSAIGGLIPYRQYFVKVIDSRYFRLYRDKIALQQVPRKTFVRSADVNVSNNTITITAHGYNTGDLVVYRADTTAIGGLDDSGVYYVIKINNNTIKLAESLIDADPRYCLDDTYFASDYVTISTYNELNLTSQGVGNYHAISKEYFINFTSAGTGVEQRFIDAMDAAGSGYNAIPAVTFISDIDATGATAQAYLNDTGGIEYVSMLSGGTGYTEETTIVLFSTDTIRSFVYINGLANKYGYVSRSITDTVGIVSVSGTPNYGFLPGEVYSISESGSTGQYVFSFPDTSLNYFAGDYVQFGVDNRASVIIDSINAQGRPTKVRIFSSGSGFEAQTFTATITSSTGSNCVLRFTTGAITSIQEGFQNRQGMLSDVNKLQDNYYYQNYSYVLRSKVPSVNWMTMVKNTVHPAGMAVFSELLVRSTLELGASFEVARQPIHFYEFPVENLHAIESIGIDYDIAVEFMKIFDDACIATEEHVSHVGKTLSDTNNGFGELVINDVGKSVEDVPITSDIIDTIDVSKTLLDTPLTTDDIYFGFLRNISESYIASDSSISDFYKYETDIILSTIDAASIQAGKGLTETVASGDSIPYMVITKVINETVTATETINSIEPVFTIPNDDPIITDVLENSFTKIVTDGVSISDNNSLSVNKAASDSLPNGVNEDIDIIEPGKAAQSTLHIMEDVTSGINKNLAETSTVSEIGNINTQDYWSYDYTSGAYEAGDYVGSNNSI